MSIFYENTRIASNNIVGDTIPVGASLEWNSNIIPINWVLEDGSELNRITHAALFAAIGTTFGAGDGSTTFNLPNSKGKTPVGVDSSQTEFNTLGKTGGEKAHSLTSDENGPHVHGVSIPYDTAQDGYIDLTGREAGAAYSKNYNTSSSGLGTAHNNLQPYIAKNKIMKAFQTSGLVAQVASSYQISAIDTYSCNYVNAIDTRLTTAEGEIDNIQTGWNTAGETWTYASVDDPTGVITIVGDVTTKYSLGMRIKFTNGGNVIYGIITAISYSSPNTTLTFLHEIDPTDSLALHLMTNSAITSNYYSSMKVPYGFPMNPDKWTVKFYTTTRIFNNSATSDVWYNFTNFQLSVPIGLYKLSWKSVIYVKTNSASIYVNAFGTLSTTKNGATNVKFIKSLGYDSASATLSINSSQFAEELIDLTSKTIYYLNYAGNSNTGTLIIGNSNIVPTMIEAVCAYL